MREITTPTLTTSAGTLTPSNQDRPRSSRSAMITPPTIMIGAVTIIVQESRTSICTCWTSFVFHVISEGAPKRTTSRLENDPTRRNTAARRSRPSPMAVRAPK